MDLISQREKLKKNLARLGVTDEHVLAALLHIKREAFLPKSLMAQAYADRPLPINEEQTISQPSLVAYMTQKLGLRPGHRVLEIGTGSGYQTAMLSELAGEVYTIEVRGSLSQAAQNTLRELGYTNIHFKIGDGTRGWPEYAPFDAIIVTAAAAAVPPELIEQLKVGGRMVIPVDSDRDQDLKLVTKTPEGYMAEILFPVRFVPIVPVDPKLS